ncbi:MAG TPA: serine hydrolase domain-containing protein [Pyrinomonadaceae bacterium]|nr:serine hydrolase domain-containing protein [Pyrinomonadaceae bacterium]
MTKYALFLLLFFAPGVGILSRQAQGTPGGRASVETLSQKTDRLFARWDNPDSPGCALAVVRGGRIIYQRNYGAASLEHGVPISSSTVFDVGSMSKQFTAMAVLMLAEQRKLSLDDDIRRYLPEIPDYGTPITIRHLLSHTSGLRIDDELLNLTDWRFGNLTTNQDVLILMSRQKGVNFTPGEYFEYNNTGYLLLAVIVSRVSGQTLREFADANIFRPLGMTRTLFRDDRNVVIKGLAQAYRPAGGGGFRVHAAVEETVGNGGVFSTVEDLALWDRNFYDRKVGGYAVVERMLVPGPELYNGGRFNYGLGLFLGTYRGLRVVEHTGDHYGYHADLLRFPDQGFSVVCLCNAADADPWTLARQVSNLYLADEFKPATKKPDAAPGVAPAPVRVSEQELSRLAGLYLDPLTDNLRRLYVKDGKLMFYRYRIGGRDNELQPLGEGRFLMLGIGTRVELTFMPERPGARRRMVLAAEWRKPVAHEAVEPVTTVAGQLAEFAGTYYSEELDTTYHIVLEGEKLILRVKNSADNPLVQQFKDAFTDAPMSLIIRFARDRKGRVTGFLLSSGSARKLDARKV